jgi:NTE family protein
MNEILKYTCDEFKRIMYNNLPSINGNESDDDYEKFKSPILKINNDNDYEKFKSPILKINNDNHNGHDDNHRNIPEYKYLVFSGGGTKGISYCGALEVLEQNKILGPNIIGYAGTSAGSIIASMLAIGYTPTEIKKIMNKMNMRDLIDDKIGFIRDGYNLIEKYGAAPGNYIYNFLGDVIKEKTGNSDYTIKQLWIDKKIKLVIVGTNMNTSSSRYFYPDSKNNMDFDIPIRKAIRISMSIPFLFEPVIYDGDYYVDGGVLDNYPLHVFDGDYPGDSSARLGLCEPNKSVLGLQIVTNNITNDNNLVNRESLSNLMQYGYSFIKTFMIENDRRMLSPAYQKRTIKIITPYYSSTNFNITDNDKKILIEAGKNCCTTFFQVGV